jgi:tetratricopeptide (TPR) repeat protein
LRALILNNLGKWEDAAAIGKCALRYYPDFGSLYLDTSRALPNCRGAAEARAVIAAGEPLLENDAVLHCMVACYDAALGNLEDAKEGLTRAFELAKGLRLKSLDEPDLARLWESLR